jgi:hypothetical protein
MRDFLSESDILNRGRNKRSMQNFQTSWKIIPQSKNSRMRLLITLVKLEVNHRQYSALTTIWTRPKPSGLTLSCIISLSIAHMSSPLQTEH